MAMLLYIYADCEDTIILCEWRLQRFSLLLKHVREENEIAICVRRIVVCFICILHVSDLLSNL